RLIVIGAGPIGCEMAQAFRSFGSDVTVIHVDPHVLPREDADAAAIVERRMAADGVRLIHGARVTRAERRGREVVVHYDIGGNAGQLVGDRILVGIGRAPNVEGIGLEAAGVRYGASGVVVDDYLRTSNPRIYAAGDVASRFKFTHVADALARIVVQNALFGTFGRKKASALVVPWCTYTTPEVAHVGSSARDATARSIEVTTIDVPLRENDRALLDGEDEGFLRVHLRNASSFPVAGERRSRLSKPSCAAWVPKPPSFRPTFAATMKSETWSTRPSHGWAVSFLAWTKLAPMAGFARHWARPLEAMPGRST